MDKSAGYDLSDPFIDDSEAVSDPHAALPLSLLMQALYEVLKLLRCTNSKVNGFYSVCFHCWFRCILLFGLFTLFLLRLLRTLSWRGCLSSSGAT